MDLEELLLEYKRKNKEKIKLEKELKALKSELLNSGVDSAEFDNVEMVIQEVPRTGYNNDKIAELIESLVEAEVFDEQYVIDNFIKKTKYKKLVVK